MTEQNFNKKDIEEAFKFAWNADKSYQSGKEAFKKYFKSKHSRKPILFKVKDLNKYKQIDLEE